MTGKPRGKFYDITGRRYGRLTVVAKGPSRLGQTSWDCQCDCGQTVNVIKHSLVRGATQSCGCFMKERSRAEIVLRSTTHGKRHSAEYSVWTGMKRRCNNPNDPAFAGYGAIGVKVTFSSFEAFLQEVGRRPSPVHQIDRIDPNGDYSPGNVRWATTSQQARNKRNTRFVEIYGQQYSLADACDAFGVSYKRTWRRIVKGGMAPAEAMGLLL